MLTKNVSYAIGVLLEQSSFHIVNILCLPLSKGKMYGRQVAESQQVELT